MSLQIKMVMPRISIRHMSSSAVLGKKYKGISKHIKPVDLYNMDLNEREYILDWRRKLEEENGSVPTNRKEFNKAKRRLMRKEAAAQKFREYQELLEVYRFNADEQGLERNRQIIAKSDLANVSFILTKDLYQYVKLGDVTYDLNSRFLEFNRRIYDYCLLRKFLNDQFDPGLDLFIELLEFKNKSLLQNDKTKTAPQVRDTFTVHMAMDKVAGIDNDLIEAVKKLKRTKPKEVDGYLNSSVYDFKRRLDFTEIPDSRIVRKRMKGASTLNSGIRRYLMNDAVEFLEDEAKKEEKQASEEDDDVKSALSVKF